MKSSADSAAPVARSPRNRSRVSNGNALLPGVDGRTAGARRYADLASALVQDAGGIERCSEARLQLIRRFAAASVLAEQLEARLANGESIDVAEHAALASTLVRLASRIGIDRRAKTVVPTVQDYIEGRAAT
jgi:hypothetical protein